MEDGKRSLTFYVMTLTGTFIPLTTLLNADTESAQQKTYFKG